MVEKSDAAYGYVKQANQKEAANKASRETPRQPSWKLNLFVVALLWFVAYEHWSQDNKTGAVLMLALSGFNLWIAAKVYLAKSLPPPADS